MRAIALYLTNFCTFGRRLLETILISLCSNEFSNIPPKLRSLNAAHVHFFLSKNAFFSKKICTCAFFVVPLQPLSKKKHFRHNMSKHATAWGRVGEWLKPTVC